MERSIYSKEETRNAFEDSSVGEQNHEEVEPQKQLSAEVWRAAKAGPRLLNTRKMKVIILVTFYKPL